MMIMIKRAMIIISIMMKTILINKLNKFVIKLTFTYIFICPPPILIIKLFIVLGLDMLCVKFS